MRLLWIILFEFKTGLDLNWIIPLHGSKMVFLFLTKLGPNLIVNNWIYLYQVNAHLLAQHKLQIR
jgi:hypothetical protein